MTLDSSKPFPLSPHRRRYRARTVLVLIWVAVLALNAGSAATPPFPHTLRWKRLIGPATSSVVVSGDSLVCIGRRNGTLLALDADSGNRLWQRKQDGPLGRQMSMAGDTLFYTDAWGAVGARRVSTGDLLWRVKRLGSGEGCVAATEGRLLVSSADGWVYALARGDGRELWRVRTALRRASVPAIATDRLYVGTVDGDIVAVEISTGRRVLERHVGSLMDGAAMADDARLIAGFQDGYVRAFATDSLTLLWETRLGAQLVGGLRKGGGVDAVICAAANGFAYSLRISDGAILWRTNLGGAPSDGIELAADGSPIVATAAGGLLALERESGAIRWRWRELAPGKGARLVPFGDGLLASADDGYLYAFAPIVETEPLSSLSDDWWEVATFGQKTGFVHRAIWARPEGGFRVLKESVAWRSGFVRSVAELFVDDAGRPQEVALRKTEDSQVLETRATWRDGGVRIRRQLGRHAVSDTLTEGTGDAVLPELALFTLFAQGRIVPGRRDTFQVVDYDRFVSITSAIAVYQPGDDGTVEVVLNTGAAPDSLAAGAQSSSPVVDIHTWLDANGVELRSAVPAMGLESRRVTRRRALQWVSPTASRRIALNHRIEDPPSLVGLTLRLPLDQSEARQLLVEDDRQRIFTDSTGAVLFEIRSRQGDSGAPSVSPGDVDEDVELFLQSSLYIQSDAPVIRDLAKKIGGAESSSRLLARKLHDWVYDHMIPTNTNVRFKSALEVLDDLEGTCSEYTVLYVALCRAAGVPARVSTGFAVSANGQLQLHIWPQVHVLGRWLEVDPSWDVFPVDAAHIKTGQGRLTPAEMTQQNLRLQLFLARVHTLDLVSYETRDGGLFLGEAETLFSSAEAADRNFEALRAAELFHELVLLPWNQRSGQAYTNLGRYYLQRNRLDDAEWALQRILTLEPHGPDADEALFYLSRVAEKRGEDGSPSLQHIVNRLPNSDLADAALARLAQIREEAHGCAAAAPLYHRLVEEYDGSGWAEAARSALKRCASPSSEPADLDGTQ